MSKNLNILPTLNFGNTGAKTANTVGNAVAGIYNSAANSLNKAVNSMSGDLGEPIMNSIQNSLSDNGGSAGLLVHMPMLIALGIVTICVILYVTFKSQVDSAIRNILQKVREAMGLSVPTVLAPEPAAETRIEMQPTSAQQHVMEKLLPPKKEVFNIAENIYTYADAAPLCKALGAELATYEQVKDAWDRGADWCNYGWIKGQAAIYPTQKDTYDKLQQGPEDQRGACGQIGVNGGYFDNPGLRFGVNCYGSKPAESAHSVKIITEGAGEPLTPEAILFDKKVRKYAAEADTIGVLPFKPGDWSS